MLWRVKEVQRFVPHFLHSPYSTGDFDIRKSAIPEVAVRRDKWFVNRPESGYQVHVNDADSKGRHHQSRTHAATRAATTFLLGGPL
jgi:hypothetical protein